MHNEKHRPTEASVNFWTGVFIFTYLIHVAEEYWAGGGYPAYFYRLRGVQFSPTRFLISQSIGLVLVIIGVVLARQFKFRRAMLIILGAIALINGLTHAFTSVSILSYAPGLFSSIFIWIPLGIFTLLRFRNGITWQSYWLSIAIGVVVNIIIAIFTMKGGRII